MGALAPTLKTTIMMEPREQSESMNNLEKDQNLSTEPQNEAQEVVNEEVKVEEPVAEPVETVEPVENSEPSENSEPCTCYGILGGLFQFLERYEKTFLCFAGNGAAASDGGGATKDVWLFQL